MKPPHAEARMVTIYRFIPVMREADRTTFNNMRPIFKQSSSRSFSIDCQKYSIDESVTEGSGMSKSRIHNRRVTFSPFSKHSHRWKCHCPGRIPTQNGTCVRGKFRVRGSNGASRTSPARRYEVVLTHTTDSEADNVPRKEWNDRVMVKKMLYGFT